MIVPCIHLKASTSWSVLVDARSVLEGLPDPIEAACLLRQRQQQGGEQLAAGRDQARQHGAQLSPLHHVDALHGQAAEARDAGLLGPPRLHGLVFAEGEGLRGFAGPEAELLAVHAGERQGHLRSGRRFLRDTHLVVLS